MASILFNWLEAAMEQVDRTACVDFDFPEKLGHGLFAQKVEEGLTVTGPSSTVVSNGMKITYAQLEDLNNRHEVSSLLVLNGIAFLLTKPGIPDFLRREHNEMFAV